VRALDGALLHAIHHAEGGHQFTAGMNRDGELAACGIADRLREGVGSAENGVECLGKARRQTPADGGGLRMHRRCDAGCQDAGDAGVLQKLATFHVLISSM
jgi:hypothetical protein